MSGRTYAAWKLPAVADKQAYADLHLRRRRDRWIDRGAACRRGRGRDGDRPRPAFSRDRAERHHAALAGRKRVDRASQGGRDRRRGRRAGSRRARGEGAFARSRGGQCGVAARARDHGDDAPERHAVVVLPAPRRPARGNAAREPRSERRAVRNIRARAHHRLRRVRRRRRAAARRGQACRQQPAADRRDRRALEPAARRGRGGIPQRRACRPARSPISAPRSGGRR